MAELSSITEVAPADPERDRLQSRTLTVLVSSTIFARASMSLAFTVAALALRDMLDSARLAGLATVAITVGTALASTWLSSLMARRGRRPGLLVGYLFGAGGAALAAVGVQTQSALIFLVGLALFGGGQASANLSRYAAADLAKPDRRGAAISLVVFAAAFGSVGGPALTGTAASVADGLNWVDEVGVFGFTTVFFLIAAVVAHLFLRPDPLVVSDGLRPEGLARVGTVETFRQGMRVIWANPSAKLAFGGLAISQAVMVTVMAMTPLHMEAHGHETGNIGFVISAHTAGMFAFAPIAGWASDRFGRRSSLAAGSVILVLATIITGLAVDAPNLLMYPGLFLLGLGWNFGVVGGSALLTESVSDEEKVVVQGTGDVTMSLAGGLGALASGFVFDMAGFHILSLIGTVSAGLLLVWAFSSIRSISSGLRAA